MSAPGREETPALRQVVIYIDTNRLEALTKTAAELAADIGTSDATVIRAVKALGFTGFLPDRPSHDLS